ncbi:MAG TPA: FmdB family zinc ribbon protein [Candidatus Acidoferrum sp.]|nr:FmdB family zinc ribbon protein [Candidatus Acidoferrum sp.]
MPLYEYQCKKCKHKFEKIQKFSDRPIKKCPECGGPLDKIQHAPNVQFKGSGWYVTDYGGKGDKSKAEGGSEKGSSEKDSAEKGGSEKKDTAAKDDGAKSKDKDKDSNSSKKSESKKSDSKKSRD